MNAITTLTPGPARQSNKLDKVVLSLKKSAGSNQWNIDNAAPKSPAKLPAASMELRRSRKSKSTPKRKIPPASDSSDQVHILNFTPGPQG
jgi:hypothetical protein